MSDLQPKQVNQVILFRTHTSGPRRVIGVDVKELPGQIKNSTDMQICAIKANVANMAFTRGEYAEKNKNVVIHGKELYKLENIDPSNSYVRWTEQRTVHIPSMALIGAPYVWDSCPLCKKYNVEMSNIVNRGGLTVSAEHCRDCHRGQSGGIKLPIFRHAWGKDPKIIPGLVDKITSNMNYVLFYKDDKSSKDEIRHKFYMLKWSELEQGNFSGMGVQVELPKEEKERWNAVASIDDWLLSTQDQICAICRGGSFILGGRLVETGILKSNKWHSIFELKSRTDRYLVAGFESDYDNPDALIKLIDGRARVVGSLAIKDERAFKSTFRLLGSSTVMILFENYLSVATVKRDDLQLVAFKRLVFREACGSTLFVRLPKSRKKLLIRNNLGKIARVKLNYH